MLNDHVPLLNRIKDAFPSDQFFPGLVAGAVIGTLEVTVAIAFASMLFRGSIQPYLSSGIGIILMGMIILSFIIPTLSKLPGLIASSQDATAAILAVISTSMMQGASASPDVLFITVFAVLALSSVLTGGLFLLLGTFKLGHWVRFIPYPVIGGFLAGSGLLLTLASLGMMTGTSVGLLNLTDVLQPHLLIQWLPGLILALVLIFSLSRSSSAFIIPAVLVIGIGVFYLVLLLTGTDIAQAQSWLLDISAGDNLLFLPNPADLVRIDVSLLLQNFGSILSVAIVSTITLLLNVSGLELEIDQNLDLDRELKAAGWGNLISGIAGGIAGCHTLSLTALCHKIGAQGQWARIFLIGILGVVLLTGGTFLSYIPNYVLGGLLLFLGLDFLIEWVYKTRAKIPRIDYAIIILITVVIGLAGFLTGVGVGLILTVIWFAISYSQVEVIQHVLDGSTYHSSVERPRLYERLLHSQKHWLYILKLQGFIFFGTADSLLNRIEARLNGPDQALPHFVILDFTGVKGIDSSATYSFARIKQIAAQHGFTLIFTAVSPDIQRQMAKQIFEKGENEIGQIFASLDLGVEWCEERMMRKLGESEQAAQSLPLNQQFEVMFEQVMPNEEAAISSQWMAYLKRKELKDGENVIRQGNPPTGIFFIQSGTLQVELESEKGERMRIRKISAGSMVGEIGLYLQQTATASVRAIGPCTLYHLTSEALEKMEAESPQMAAAFHRYMAQFLSERLSRTTDSLKALMD